MPTRSDGSLSSESRTRPSCPRGSIWVETVRTRPLISVPPSAATLAVAPGFSLGIWRPGTSTSRSILPSVMMRNSGSACADAIAPTIVALPITMPATGALTVVVAAGAPPCAARDSPMSPSLTRISVTLKPSESTLATATCCGTRNPATGCDPRKQALVALATMTMTPDWTPDCASPAARTGVLPSNATARAMRQQPWSSAQIPNPDH